MSKYIAVNRLERKVGIELTWVKGGLELEDKDILGELACQYRRVFASRIEAVKLKVWNVGTDPDVVEIPTVPLRSRAKMRRTIDTLYGIADSLGFVPNYPWHGGGGAHVHVSRSVKDKADGTHKALLLDIAARPYITWAFCNPGDTANAVPLCTAMDPNLSDTLRCDIKKLEGYVVPRIDAVIASREKIRNDKGKRYYWEEETFEGEELRKRIMGISFEESLTIPKLKLDIKRKKAELVKAELLEASQTHTDALFKRVNTNACSAVYLNHVGSGLNGNIGTYEFRCFKAPDSPHEHELHVNFVLAYIEMAKEMGRSKRFTIPKYCHPGDLFELWPYERSALEFRKLIKKLGLNWVDYKHYLLNMKARYDLGKEYVK